MARAKTQEKAEKPAKPQEPKETRSELNDRARFDYGIVNAADMQESQLRDEIKAIDQQAVEGRKANEAARKEAEENA